MPYLFAFILALNLFTGLVAQPKNKKNYGVKSSKAIKLYEKANNELRWRNYGKAIEYLDQALQIEPKFQAALFDKGYALFMNKQSEKAVQPLQELYTLNPKFHKELPYYYGMSLFAAEKYEQSEPLLQEYLKNKPSPQLQAKAETNLKKTNFAKNAIKNPVPFNPQNLGTAINSAGDDYFPCLTADEQTLYFTSRREGNIGGFISMLNDFSEDFFYSEFRNNQWQDATNLSKPINTAENEGAPSFSADGKWVYYTYCNSQATEGGCDIYYAQKIDNYWLNPKNVSPVINTRYWESHPCISQDGKTLYFVSNRPGGKGGADIWFSVKDPVTQKWSEPQNLGEPINTPGNEYSPFLHADDQTLYFSSDYHPGMGGYDLFLSRKNANNQWSEPQNLGYPINTSKDEVNIFVNTTGNKAYINSDRPGGRGKNDIYVFELPQNIQPNLATYVKGKVYDSKTQQHLVAEILFIDLQTADTIRRVHTDPSSGDYLLTLPANKAYAAIVKKPAYLLFSQHFDLSNLKPNEHFLLDIPLQPIEKQVPIVLKNIFFDFNQATLKPESFIELNQLLKFLQDNPQLIIEIGGHTDDVGSDEYNLNLSQKRADAVKDYLVQKGISENRLVAKGYGKSKPIASNATEEGRAQNRRTEFMIIGM